MTETLVPAPVVVTLPEGGRADDHRVHFEIDRTFDAVIFDWDGTAVPDRSADASTVRARVEHLCAAGVDVFVVSGTHVGNVDGQLQARPAGPGKLRLCLNRGSEVFDVGPQGPRLAWSRTATPEEEAALDRAAALTVARLAALGSEAKIVSQRLNRRKIDLIPEAKWADPPKAHIAELLVAVTERLHAKGLSDLSRVVALARSASRQAGLVDPRITSDVKHVEIGLTDKSDSARWAFADLRARGIGPGLVLIVGDEFGPIGGAVGSDSMLLVAEGRRSIAVSVGIEPEGVPDGIAHIGGGPKTFIELLDQQLERRSERRVPWTDEDPAWTFVIEGDDPTMRRVYESMLTLGAGGFGLRGAKEEDGEGTEPLVVAGSVFDVRDGAERLLPAPLWTTLAIAQAPGSPQRRILDMRSGLLLREHGARFRSMRLVSLARPGAMALRAEGIAGGLVATRLLVPPPQRNAYERGVFEGGRWGRTHSTLGGGICAAVHQTQLVTDGLRTVERLAVYDANPHERPSPQRAIARLRECSATGFDGLLAEHRAAWAERWHDIDISIHGDPETERAVRFALFHLNASVADAGETALGARGVSGPAYAGHVFWDSDVFVLPVFAATHPAAARAMLEYRLRRLPAARHAAAERHLDGARFPWESAHDGRDVTPRSVRGANGTVIPIRTGEREEHIVADVAWAAHHYAEWTGDEGFLDGPGRALLTETARYWASRARFDTLGHAHIYGVIGPDEYHEIVDDNAYTNVMARWNLRRAAALVGRDGVGASRAETERWLEIADALADGFDPTTRLYEQFSGFSSLEPLIISQAAAPPVAADVLLGRERVAGSQVIKQADVLMLHHLVPEEVAEGSLEPNLTFYEPRTSHGSSLSPALHAALLARAGKPDRALELFRIACRMDLDDLTGTTAGGLHMGALGGVWQALAYGFAGVRPVGASLGIDPHLPPEWSGIDLRVRFRGSPLRLHVAHELIRLQTGHPVQIRFADGHTVGLTAGDFTFAFAGTTWEEVAR